MADEKITRSKLSEKDHRKDTEDDQEVGTNISGPKPKDTSKEKSKATTQAQKNTKEEKATKKKPNKLQIGVGDTKGLERKTKLVRGKEIADSSGGEIKYASETQSETETPMETDDEFELVKAEAESFSDGDYLSLDLTNSDDSNRSVEEFTIEVHGSPGVIVEDYLKLKSDTSDDAGAVTPETGGVFSPETEDELKQSESGSSIYLDAHTTFEGLEKKSGFELEINTNIEGLKEELYGVSRPAKKGKAKLEREGKESDDDDLEVETNIEGLAEAMRELYRQVTKGTKGKLKRLVKNREEYSSEAEELELELDRECEMLLKTPLRLMLELDTEIRGLVEELDVLLTLKEDDEAGPKLRALRDELEVLKESNYVKEVELIGMVKELIDDDAGALAIDAVVQSEVDPIVENAEEKMARVKSEIKEVEAMDRNKSSDAAEN
ncbi:hypothetical protein RHGRI_005471 [Rhododendron griersonianum]|uniref:Uncharacterized protein n=1 Tax=Rhododendron griersonianum TaxID=479676 RepID=A0AAV6LEB7_9ERIC|nr:hypothetical protein RHGRI_005471 [Rhododendron griersonianum]